MTATLLRPAAAFVAIAVIAGCGVVPPRVGYQNYSEEAAAGESMGYLFRHRRSVIVVTFSRETTKFDVFAAPDEFTPDNRFTPLYRLAGADDAFSATQLKVSYVANTKFIDQIQVTTKDNLVDAISKIGAVAALAPRLASGSLAESPTKGAQRVFEPTLLDPWAADVEQWRVDPVNPRYCLRLRETSVESDLSIDRYVARAAGRMVGTFPVPACATGIVEIAPACDGRPQEAKAEYSYRVVFAHARNVVPMQLPSTGALKMHSVCGASVTPADNQDRTTLLDHLTAAIKTVQDVQGSWHAKGAGTQKPAAAKPPAGTK